MNKVIVMSETSKEFREGFEFCIVCIRDMVKNKENYSVEKLNNMLESIIDMIDKGVYWYDRDHIKSLTT